ncbi:MAG: tetratricopeptide repeat protein [Candidatus Delongbacteria bacterium]|nr:tetratricopeptide repeat protein [Candidatus Delongbacteria bacterium]MBN2834261.1 tetratricopeptide repeat protein [Candidatus Delongbacteria bacterium]
MSEIDLNLLNRMGKDLAAAGDTENAISVLRAVNALDSNFFKSRFNLGVILFHLKKYKESISEYRKALQINPSDRNTLINFSYTSEFTGDVNEAIEYLRTFIIQNKDDLEVKNLLSYIESKKVLENDVRKLKILFIQSPPCIRNYKMAKALKSRGHKVTLLYGLTAIDQIYKWVDLSVYNEVIKMNSFNAIWHLSRGFDIIHCHNEPDSTTIAALGCKVPLVHDTHDIISLRDRSTQTVFNEMVANRGADARVYTNGYQKEYIYNAYNVDGPYEIIGNYISKDDLPLEKNDKLSAIDGKFHLVYQGSISNKNQRDFQNIFDNLIKVGFVVHVHPEVYNEEVAKTYRTIDGLFYYHPIPAKDLMETMTKYDAGIIPWNVTENNRSFLDTTVAMKLYEYYASGLPVATSPARSYEEYFSLHQNGIIFNNAEELWNRRKELEEIRLRKNLKNYAKCYEDEIPKLEKLYYDLISER